MNRRKFLIGAGVTALSGAACLYYAHDIAPFQYQVTERDVWLQNLPDAFDGFRITQLTDLHHSSLVSLAEVETVVRLANATKPDAFVMTGDFTTNNKSNFLSPCVEALRKLEAPHGVLAVLGNHDQRVSYHNRETIAIIKRGDLGLLLNENTGWQRGGQRLQIAGINDYSWAQTDWTKAAKGIDFSQATLLLSHQPVVFDTPQARAYSLILAGHTHGGQVALPLIGAPVRVLEQFKYIEGLFARDASQMYVSRGTGMVGLPLRFCAAPEIAVFRLRRAEELKAQSL